MNERIKHLMGKTLDSKFSHTWTTLTYQDLEKFSEKFAELIVGECLNMCADTDGALRRIQDNEHAPDSIPVLHGAADYEYAAAYSKQIDHYESIARGVTSAGDKIREHFGVEEWASIKF
jgi:hypothetical protein